MASNNENKAQLINRGFQSCKQRMRAMEPREIFHFRIPEPEEYQVMDEDVDYGYGDYISEPDEFSCSETKACASMEGKSPNLGCDFEYYSSDVGSIFYPYSTHESENGYETYSPKSDDFNPSLDDSSSTHHQDNEHEHESRELDGILEPDECELMVEDDYGDISVSDEYSGSEINPQYDQFEHESSRVDSICDSCDAHESEQGHERDNSQSGCYTPHRDDLSSTHHQDDDDEQESDELDASFCPASPEPSSPPRLAFYFDCKLCLKMAREPVVTSCGHLFCGDCLDKWLNFFTSQMECPVCHSKVLDSSIIPIRPTPVCNRDLDYGLNLSPRPNGDFSLEDLVNVESFG